MLIAGNRVLISCEGQPATCYGCGAIGHLHQVCPLRRVKETETQEPAKSTYASVVTNTVITHSGEMDDKNTTTGRGESQNTPATPTKTPQIPHPLILGETKILPDTDTEPNKTIQMDTTPIPADEPDGRPSCSHMDDVEKWQGPKTAEMPLKGRLSRRQTDKQVQEMATGTYNIVAPMTDTSCQESDEVSINAENDQGFPPLTRENTQEEIRYSPKRTKKLKMEKVGEHQAERSSTLPRRVPSKSGKS